MTDPTPDTPPQDPQVEPDKPEAQDAAGGQKPPPWGDDFDPKKAWERIQQQSKDIAKLKGQKVLTADAETKLAEYDKLVAASKTDLERLQDAVNAEKARAESLLTAAVMAKVEALAATAFADPSDAAAFLDLSKYGSDGAVDGDAIKADLADLLTRKPHLARKSEPGEPKPYPGQGASAGGAGGVEQWTREQVEQAAREGRHADIEQARLDGKLDTLMGAKK